MLRSTPGWITELRDCLLYSRVGEGVPRSLSPIITVLQIFLHLSREGKQFEVH